MSGKRYFGIVLPTQNEKAAMCLILCSNERGAHILEKGTKTGGAIDYYPDEETQHRKDWGRYIIGDYPDRKTAEEAVEKHLNNSA